VYTVLSSFSAPKPGRSTLPRPSGQPSPSSSSSEKMKRMFALVKPYMSSRNRRSPVQRQTSATALGNLAVSSVLPASASAPKYTEPSVMTSCTTLPLEPLMTMLASLSARRCASIGSNWPSATEANAEYSPSVANIHG
jgi:hypothetical protein